MWRTQTDKIQNRTWKAHAKIQRENTNSGCACALRDKLTFHTDSWPSDIVHSIHGHEKYRMQQVRRSASDLFEVCNASRRLVFGSSGLHYRLNSTRLWLVLQTSHTRLESPSLDTCYKIYALFTRNRRLRTLFRSTSSHDYMFGMNQLNKSVSKFLNVSDKLFNYANAKAKSIGCCVTKWKIK